MKPVLKLDPGILEHLSLSPRALIGPGARSLEFLCGIPTLAACQEGVMEILHPCCCGLDVHEETVVACVRLVTDGKLVKEVRTCSTTTASLIELYEWLTETRRGSYSLAMPHAPEPLCAEFSVWPGRYLPGAI